MRVGNMQQRARSVNFETLDGVPHIETLSPLSPDRYDKDTAVQGIRKRYAREVPKTDRKAMEGFRKFVAKWVVEKLPRVGQIIGFEEWLASTSYNDARKEQLREVYDRWLLQGRPAAAVRKLLHKVKAFIKSEHYPQYKHARHINARCDLAKCVFGPVIKTMERLVYELPEFIKHVPIQDRPALIKRMKRSGCRYVASDHTAFEAHFTKEVMSVVEFEVCRHMLQNHPDIEALLEDTEAGMNDIKLKSSDIRVLIEGMRCSGDMWTSLFNGLGNLLSFLYGCEMVGCKFVEGFVEGDDGIFAVQGVPPTAKDMEKLGFEVKYEYHDDPATASFCGLILAGDSIVRDPTKFFMGFGWCDRFIGAGPKVKRQLALAKALSALYETPGCPIVAAAAEHVYESTRGVEARFIDGAYRTVPKDYAPPRVNVTAETRDLFSRLYGISPSAQIDAEEAIRRGDWGVLDTILPVHPDVRDFTSKYVEEI